MFTLNTEVKKIYGVGEKIAKILNKLENGAKSRTFDDIDQEPATLLSTAARPVIPAQ